MSEILVAALFYCFWTRCPEVERRENEVFTAQAVCSTLAEHTHMEMQIGGAYARGSNAENNRSCN